MGLTLSNVDVVYGGGVQCGDCCPTDNGAQRIGSLGEQFLGFLERILCRFRMREFGGGFRHRGRSVLG